VSGILVVEDDSVVRSFMDIFLGAVCGHDVRCVETVKEARTAVMDSVPEVLVVDLCLPDGSGLDLCVEALRVAPGIRVVLVTGMELTDACRMAAEDSEIAVLRKPFELDHLLVLVGKGSRS